MDPRGNANPVCAFYSAPPPPPSASSSTASSAPRAPPVSASASMPTASRKFLRASSSNLPALLRSTSRPLVRPLRDAYLRLVASTSRLRSSRSLRLIMRKATYIHLLLLPAFLLLALEMSPPPPRHIAALPPSAAASVRAAAHDARPAGPLFPTSSDVRPGVSIVACCMNRHATLRTVLPAWRGVANVSEIVLVDWGSSPPLHRVVADVAPGDARVRVIRVDAESAWILSRAYNLGVAAARFETVIRTDCDYTLARAFLSAHPLPKRAFYAGNYKHARNENEVHLNGAVLIRRADFLAVGGYDERIQTYGWDDEDLYTRLQAAGLQKLNLSYDHVSHVPHGDGARAQRDVKFVQVEIDLNSILLSKLPAWNASAPAAVGSRWAVRPRRAGDSAATARVSAASRAAPLKELVDGATFDAAWNMALSQRLANDYAVPWDIMVTLPTDMKRRLLTRLNKRAAARAANAGPPRILFAHVMHGLGNRLRALGSAMAFANNTGRELVLVWETDAHIAARFDELFADDLVVLRDFKPKWPFRNADKYDKSWLVFDLFNYMEMEGDGAVKGQRIVDKPDKHVYVKSAYVLEADAHLTDWDKDNAMLRSLKPVPSVVDMVRKHESAGLAGMVGVHIRDRTLERDIQNVDFGAEYGDAASKEMEFWRKRSSYVNFMNEMRAIVHTDPKARFYVATDTVGVIDKLRAEFADRVVTTPRQCDGRDGPCVRFALVDILCLARTKALIGSNWSSFTEAASRFGNLEPRLAGRDFANATDVATGGAKPAAS